MKVVRYRGEREEGTIQGEGQGTGVKGKSLRLADYSEHMY